MNVSIEFLGGAGTVTGSKHLIRIGFRNVLLDCGLFQGLKELRLQNWEGLPIANHEIDAVVLSHAHLDHSGYLPRLVKHGYKGPIYCTQATADLLKILLMDSAKLQEEDALFAKKKGFSKHFLMLLIILMKSTTQKGSSILVLSLAHAPIKIRKTVLALAYPLTQPC